MPIATWHKQIIAGRALMVKPDFITPNPDWIALVWAHVLLVRGVRIVR